MSKLNHLSIHFEVEATAVAFKNKKERTLKTIRFSFLFPNFKTIKIYLGLCYSMHDVASFKKPPTAKKTDSSLNF